MKVRVVEDEQDPEWEDAVTISCVDEYGGEWGTFFVAPGPGASPSREWWIGVSHAWELYCRDSIPDQVEDGDWEWAYVGRSSLGKYYVAEFQSADRGGRGLFVLHPRS